MYEKWKEQRKVKEEKVYKKFIPGKDSAFDPVNRRRMMNVLGKYQNMFRIIDLKNGKTERLFRSASNAFKFKPNKETINRGTLNMKDFSRMFPLKGAV
jgi:hypothetical protein